MPDCIGDVKALKKSLEENKMVVKKANIKIKETVESHKQEENTEGENANEENAENSENNGETENGTEDNTAKAENKEVMEALWELIQ